MRLTRISVLSVLAGTSLACAHKTPAPVAPAAPVEAAPAAQVPPTFDRLNRTEFNRMAVRLNLPMLWKADRNENRAVDPDELAALLFYSGEHPDWVHEGKFTPGFEQAYEDMVAQAVAPRFAPGMAPSELERRTLVIEDLDQGRPTLVHNDLRQMSESERAFARRMLTVAGLIDELYTAQNGLGELAGKIPTDDPASQRLFARNWGPGCVGPTTEKNPACSAVPGAPKQIFGLYPAELQQEAGFCGPLAKHTDARALLDPFVIVRSVDGKLRPIPYHEAWPEQTRRIAEELRAAAAGLDPSEAALKTYLESAAQGFTDDNWVPADEAWSRMNARNSRWYVRVAPDEVYWEPCSEKAGFHLSFALINPESLRWQEKLDPFRQAMEQSLAKLIGAPYKARKVSFQLPDFIDIVVNAGDDRDPMGGTIGQSLPNWGPVANEGRGRTVVMSNLYLDTDSLQSRRAQAESLFTRESLADFADEQDLLSTILHEATHNLGPSHEYKVRGKTDSELFGGPLSSTLEELKAQSGALWYTRFLAGKGAISQEQARQTWISSLAWAMGHISRGMYDANGKPKAYSHVSAIQVGLLMKDGAMRFDPDAVAANGIDHGAFIVDFEKLPASVESMMKRVGKIKATGDRRGAEELVKTLVDSNVVPQSIITERVLRQPKASFVYAIDL